MNSSLCLPQTPKLLVGLRGSTSNIFIDNAAYRKFLFQTFGISSVDMESAAVVMASSLFEFRYYHVSTPSRSSWSSPCMICELLHVYSRTPSDSNYEFFSLPIKESLICVGVFADKRVEWFSGDSYSWIVRLGRSTERKECD